MTLPCAVNSIVIFKLCQTEITILMLTFIQSYSKTCTFRFETLASEPMSGFRWMSAVKIQPSLIGVRSLRMSALVRFQSFLSKCRNIYTNDIYIYINFVTKLLLLKDSINLLLKIAIILLL